jgi:hypothetical protein
MHQDTKLNFIKQFCFGSLWLCGFVAILSGLSRLGVDSTLPIYLYHIKRRLFLNGPFNPDIKQQILDKARLILIG